MRDEIVADPRKLVLTSSRVLEVWTYPDLVERLSLCDGHFGLE